jgi:O-antigen/teichoic acid export membrane protein
MRSPCRWVPFFSAIMFSPGRAKTIQIEKEVSSERMTDGLVLAKGGAVTGLAYLASLFRAIFTILVAWTLGATALGTLALAWSLADLLSKLGTFGIDTTVLILTARQRELGDVAGAAEVLKKSIAWGLLLSGAVAFLGIAGLQLFGSTFGQSGELARASSVMLLALPGIALYRISNGASRGMWQPQHDFYSHGLTETFSTIAMFAVALGLGFGALAPIVATLSACWASGLVAFYLALSVFRSGPRTRAVPGQSRKLLAASFPVALNNLLIILMQRMNILLLGALVGRVPGLTLGTLGIYAAAFELSNLFRKLQQSFGPMFTPVIAAALAHHDRPRMERAFGQLARWMLAAQLPFLALFIVSGGLILCSYGPDYRIGAVWLALLGLANVLGTFAALAGATMVAVRPSSNLLTSLLALPPQLVLTLLLVRWAGPTGAALAALASYLLQSGIRYWEMKRVFRWECPWYDLAKPCAAFFAGLIPAAAIRFFWSGLVAELTAGLIFLGLYFFAWRWLGMDEADRALLDQILHKRRQNKISASSG